MFDPLPSAHTQRLIELLRADQLVLFVGAGISRQAPPLGSSTKSEKHIPLWDELANILASNFGDDLKNYNGNVLDLFDSLAANHGRGELEEAVRRALSEQEFQPSQTHYAIAQLPWNMVVTTNYDSLLERSLPEASPIANESDFDWLTREVSRRPRLVKLHGTMSSMHTLIGTDYIDWMEKHPRAYLFLSEIALNKTILFVGYSFSDPHLKTGLIPWVKKAMGGRGKRHYAWLWDVSPQQIKLLDTREMIEAHSITRDSDWTMAFRQMDEVARTPRIARLIHKKSVTPDSFVPLPDIAIVNGYKLFFFRTQKQWTVKRLAAETNINVQVLNDLEQVRTTVAAGPNCFRQINRNDLGKIEHALGCIGRLEFSNSDDFRARYTMFYRVNKLSRKKKKRNATLILDFASDTKAVVFDFGGTLTRPFSQLSTWERMWTSVGYTLTDSGHHHRRFDAKQITHQEWCNITATRLAEKGFSQSHLDKIIEDISPVHGLLEALETLEKQGTALYIVSGSIKQIIARILGPAYSLFAEVRANEIRFRPDGIIHSIKSNPYDFEGKALFIKSIIYEQKCNPLDILFVGNSLNDTWASDSGARTLCVNPSDVDFNNTLIWTECIREMTDLRQILPHAKRGVDVEA
jgi:phosphoserine phosphatase